MKKYKNYLHSIVILTGIFVICSCNKICKESHIGLQPIKKCFYKQKIKSLLSKERNVYKQIEMLNDTLLLAIQNNNKAYAKVLLESRAHPNKKDKEGNTPLMTAVAISKGNIEYIEIVSLLLKNGADPNIQNNKDYTALIYAVAMDNSNTEIVRLLLENGADPNIQDQYGQTALMIAVQQGNIAIMFLLLKNGANPDIQDQYGQTALAHAVHNTDNSNTKSVRYIQDQCWIALMDAVNMRKNSKKKRSPIVKKWSKS